MYPPEETLSGPPEDREAPSAGTGAGAGLSFHHVGVAVEDMEAALEYYTSLFGFKQLSPPETVPEQSVRVCFVEAGPGVLIELIEGIGEHSPVAGVLRRAGAGPYHLCYKVDDLDRSIERLKEGGCLCVRRFVHAGFGLRRFAFLFTPDRQLFELCEEDKMKPIRLANPSRRYMFETLFFEATRRCNLSCPMCMTASNEHRWVGTEMRGKELTTDEVERHILATAKDIGIRIIAWSGGEFLVRKDAVELVRRATEYGYESTICSNALLVTRERLAELNEASGGTLVMAFGINSIDEEHSWTRDADGARTLAVLDMCKEMGIRRHVVVNVGQHNLDSLERTFAWLEEQGIPYNRSPFTARGSGGEYWNELHFNRTQMEEKIHPALRAHPIGYISYTPFFLSPELHSQVSGGAHNATVPLGPSIGCWCGTWLAVNSEGDVAPCGILLDDVNCGNVRDKTFEEIIDQSQVFQRVLDRSQLKGRCGRCRYKYTCGGCRAMAYYESGDLMGEDPTCFFEPEDENTVSPHEEETNRMFKRYLFMRRLGDRERRKQMKEAAGARKDSPATAATAAGGSSSTTSS